MALRHGELALPRILISALSPAGVGDPRTTAPLNVETYQVNGAEKVLILPRSGRTTFLLNVESDL